MPTSRFIFALVWLGFMAVAPAQHHYPKKDIAFGQIVVGDGFETVLNLTNRGTSEYVGMLQFFRLDNAPWNLTVNGRDVENGEYEIKRIWPGYTLTLRLTGSELESGAAVLLSDDLLLNNLVGGNLTYRVHKDGQVSDSVGIAPSREFYRAALPFNNFTEVGLALVNGDASGELPAQVELILFSPKGEELETEFLVLGPRSHRARFLHEFFPEQTLERGKIEIASDVPIFGTALTLTGGEFSSLPLDPAAFRYSVRLQTGDRFATGELALWAQGSFLRGYLAILRLDGGPASDPEFSLVNGELEGGRFRLAFTILQDPFLTQEVTLSLGHDQFSFGAAVVSGEWIELFQDGSILEGAYELRRLDTR